MASFFLLNGVLFANLVPRFPEVRARLDLTNTSLGTAIAAMPAGALLAGLFAPALIRRFGSARTAAGGLVLLAVAVALVPLSGAWLGFAAVMLCAGALDAIVDVSMNAHGFRVQRRYGRSIVNAFHGLWSVGSVIGGLMGSAAAGLEIDLPVHLAISGGIFGTSTLVASRFALPGHDDAEREVAQEVGVPGLRGLRSAARPTVLVLALAGLGLLAACGSIVEDVGASWSAIYLRNDLGVAAAAAGLGFVALQVAMTAGRLFGDRVVDRFGRRRVAAAGGVLVAAAMGFAIAVPSLATTLVGLALAGLGVSTIVPAAMHTADELPGLPRGVGLAAVSWALRVGFLISPPIVGVIADAAGLRVGLLVVVVAGLGVSSLGRILGNEPPRAAAPPRPAA
ncbi:MAG TPA: MFS transporter [Actinomycetota bacterium]|nr:MFS transporter [Actinomycetota bacterium]